ncbi:MAG: hypothetical protein Q7P63_12905 [Verrucomicrobiota bacterium JB022]|nr:hypothetical protein [Verrucomicrobiota bacterium JB022]
MSKLSERKISQPVARRRLERHWNKYSCAFVPVGDLTLATSAATFPFFGGLRVLGGYKRCSALNMKMMQQQIAFLPVKKCSSGKIRPNSTVNPGRALTLQVEAPNDRRR